MENFNYFPFLALSFAISLILIATQVSGQSRTICTEEMIRTFTPCIYFLAIRTNASSPSSECCNSLRNLMSNGQDCLCLIITGDVPFQVPLNRTLAMSLPRACRMSGVPVECKATPSPLPGPGPQNRGEGRPNMSPRAPPPSPSPENRGDGRPNVSPRSPPPSPRIPFIPQGPPPPSLPPAAGGRVYPPPAPPDDDSVPILTPPGKRPTLTPSAAHPRHGALPLPSLLAVSGIILYKYY